MEPEDKTEDNKDEIKDNTVFRVLSQTDVDEETALWLAQRDAGKNETIEELENPSIQGKIKKTVDTLLNNVLLWVITALSGLLITFRDFLSNLFS